MSAADEPPNPLPGGYEDDEVLYFDKKPETYTGMQVIVEDIYGLQIQVEPVKRELKEYIYNENTK